MSADGILANLNASQTAAVSSPARTLAILAGPGSGKTHTLTSRAAWLLHHEGLQPWNVIVATFTVKAAREMKERIGKLIGDGMEAKLVLGTFHSIARRYLTRYGHLIDIRRDFGIADSGDSLAIIKRIVKRHNLTIEPSATRSRISSRKARGGEPGSLPGGGKWPSSKSVEVQEFETCYSEYEDALKRSNLLDYDDLLLRCVDLLRACPSCVSNVEAVLIDEFQDTNLVQFDLMRLFASEKKRITIVGDPDQSIYGFRSAETKNFKRMLTQYPDTVTIPLEENYRSSGSILLTALEVIQQDEGRISKSLLPTHNVGTRPVLRKLVSAHAEAQWIVTEIRRCLGLTGNLMTFDDVAILLRSASLSRHIESALGKAGITYRMVGGHRFFDRVEVKVLLDYLRVINQPDNNDALARVINVPSRRIGDTTVKLLLEEAEKSSMTLWKLILDNVQGNKNCKTKLAKQTEQGLSFFVNLILTARKKMTEAAGSGPSITELIDYIIKKISFEDFIEKCYPEDHETRWANIQEFINQASDFTDLTANSDVDDEALPQVEGLQQDGATNLLSKFLANIALASDVKANEASAPKAQITISTIHAAKGLEWPVVFIPATYEGSIPHSRADDADEERRLLYVAMTRAKALLYMSYPVKNSQREQTTLSPFLAPSCLKPFLENKGPSFTTSIIQSVAQILRRTYPSEINVQGLESLEDDLWPLDGEDKVQNERSLDGRYGSPHYTQGQRPLKRQRVEKELAVDPVRELWQPLHSTTMSQSATFSTANVTLMSGFVSAGSHLKEISAGYVNAHVERRQSSSTPCLADTVLTSQAARQRKERKATAIGSNGRTGEKEHISNFFTKTSSASLPRNQSACNETVKQQLLKAPTNDRPAREFSSFPRADNTTPAILPSLADHRLNAAPLPATGRNCPKDDAMDRKAYIFLSSSPPKTTLISETKETATSMTISFQNKEESIAMERLQPAVTRHVTTMSHLNTLSMPRKTLGIRRDMNGWANRKGTGFVAPRMQRPQ